uniref:Uncharacterized protein n=1 Tax=Timema poppense TaxID=170557 RepID=A0A7R9GZD0_TIMPO|nr:unnamed protein product [Timema poppensis]
MSVMPPRKEPWSLYKTSIRYVLNLIGEACSTLEKRYGNYDQDKCREQIVIFQEYLAYNLPSTILDELWDTRRFVTETNLKNDHRILTAVSMHRNMLKFIVNHESYKFKVCGDNSFWMTQLSRLNNLVVLDLYLACTDEILEVVGKCCPQLEQIDIVSKMEADHTYADGNNLFNALKIKFFVSDNGLLHLSKCKKLKVIYMNKMIRSQSAGRVVSKSGIRQLIKALPNIEFVSYNDMGLVIAQEMDDVRTLSLRRIIDQHPDISHIFAAARLCPKLDNLSLCFPTFENAVGSHVMILNALAESTINSTTLELIMFPIGDSFFSLLSVKGHLLYCLRLHCDNISAKLVCVIGQCCLGLKQLHLRETTVGRPTVESLKLDMRVHTVFGASHHNPRSFNGITSLEWNSRAVVFLQVLCFFAQSEVWLPAELRVPDPLRWPPGLTRYSHVV